MVMYLSNGTIQVHLAVLLIKLYNCELNKNEEPENYNEVVKWLRFGLSLF